MHHCTTLVEHDYTLILAVRPRSMLNEQLYYYYCCEACNMVDNKVSLIGWDAIPMMYRTGEEEINIHCLYDFLQTFTIIQLPTYYENNVL